MTKRKMITHGHAKLRGKPQFHVELSLETVGRILKKCEACEL
jgi:hypothetical protein